MASSVDRAKRALVSLLMGPAKLYCIVLDIARDSVDVDIRRAFKRFLERLILIVAEVVSIIKHLTTRMRLGSNHNGMPKEFGRGRQRSTATPPFLHRSFVLAAI